MSDFPISEVYNTFTTEQKALLAQTVRNMLVYGPSIVYFLGYKAYRTLDHDQKILWKSIVEAAVIERKEHNLGKQ